MPRYFFSTSDDEPDDVGKELNDHTAARKFAIQFAGEVMANQPDVLWDGREFRVLVTDQHRDLLFIIIMMAINAPAAGSTA